MSKQETFKQLAAAAPELPGIPAAPDAPVKPRRSLDAELQTMAKIDRLLADLTPSQARRVLDWCVGKYCEDDLEPTNGQQ